MSVLIEFAMFPTDKGESVSKYVSRIIKYIDSQEYAYQLTPMGTIIETENIAEALKIIESCYDQLEPDCNRVYSSIKIDIRKGGKGRMRSKIQSIEDKIGNINK